MSLVKLVSKDLFDNELKSDKLVFIDFYADWCSPCKMLSPILDELSNEYKDKVVFLKVDIDKDQDIAVKYKIRNIPALFIFKDGNIVGQKVGAMSKSMLKAFIDSCLA